MNCKAVSIGFVRVRKFTINLQNRHNFVNLMALGLD